MSLFQLARRLFTRPASSTARPVSHTRLTVERIEDRVNPVAVIAPVADLNGIIQVVNAGGAATITIRTEGVNGLRIQGTGAADVTYAAGTFKAINVIAADGTPITVVNPAGDTLAGVAGLQQVSVTGNVGNDSFNFLGATNPNIYYRVDLGSGANTFVAADGGVNVLSFTEGAAGSVAVTPSAGERPHRLVVPHRHQPGVGQPERERRRVAGQLRGDERHPGGRRGQHQDYRRVRRGRERHLDR